MQKSALTRPFTLRRCKGVSIMCELALRKALLHRCKGVSSPFIKWIVRSFGPAHEHDSSIVVASQNIYVLIYFYANSGSPSDRCRCCSNVLVWRLHWYYETCAGYGNSKASFFLFSFFVYEEYNVWQCVHKLPLLSFFRTSTSGAQHMAPISQFRT